MHIQKPDHVLEDRAKVFGQQMNPRVPFEKVTAAKWSVIVSDMWSVSDSFVLALDKILTVLTTLHVSV